MATATATPDSGWIVRLTTDAPGPGIWYRRTYGGQDRRIATTQTAVDPVPPLNIPLDYYWTGPEGPVSAPQVTVVSEKPLLSTIDGLGVQEVVVVDQPPMRFEGRSVSHAVIGRRDPVVSILPTAYPAGRLRLYVKDRNERIRLITLMDPGKPLALRSTCPEAVDDIVFKMNVFSDSLVSDAKKAGPRWMDIDYQAVAPAPADYWPPPDWTWADVEATYASWEAVERLFADWAALEGGP